MTTDGTMAAERRPSREVSTLPPVCAAFVARPDALSALDAARGKVAAVVAPSGYGKTSLVATWLRDDDAVAWVDVPPGAGDPGALVAAIVDRLGAAVGQPLGPVPPAVGPWVHVVTAVAPRVARAIGAVDRPFSLVVDGVERLDPSAIDVLEEIGRCLPPAGTLVLVGSAAPARSLARLRVSPGLVEIRADLLRLDVDAAAALLAERHPGRGFARADVVAIVDATEGWPVGTMLASPAAAAAENPEDLAADHALSDFVLAEWLSALPPADQQFLRHVAVLDELDGDACDVVSERTGSGAALDRIHTDHSLLVPLDRRHERYRMHEVLRAALQRQARREEPCDHRRRHRLASELAARRGDVDAAIRHAVEADERERAVDLVLEHGPVVYASGRVQTTARWLALFGQERVAADPRLALVAALNAFGEHDVRRSRVWVDLGLAGMDGLDDHGELRDRLITWRSLLSPSPEPDAVARTHAALTPGAWRALSGIVLAGCRFAAGEADAALVGLGEAIPEAEVSGALTTAAIGHAMAGVVLDHLGDTGGAARAGRAAGALIRTHALFHAPSSVFAFAVSSMCRSAAGDRDGSVEEWNAARRGLAMLGSDVGWATIQVRIALARGALARGDLMAARTLTREARTQVDSLTRVDTARAQVAALEERLARAAATPANGASAISTAELRVLQHLATNLTLAEIGEVLFLSRNTVKSHSMSIYRKLGVDSRRECVTVARAVGLLPGGTP